jgi:hypothetical protein
LTRDLVELQRDGPVKPAMTIKLLIESDGMPL